MILESPNFKHNGEIPVEHTCQGRDVSPTLKWSQVPPNTQSLVLIVDDPDAPDPQAPKMTYVHWLLYNIPTSINTLAKGVGSNSSLLPSDSILVGNNDWGRSNYGGPCPPIGRHRYFFKLYALDVFLPDLDYPKKQQLEDAMKGHIIEKAEFIGTYQKANFVDTKDRGEG